MTNAIKSHTLSLIYLLGFFFSFHVALPTYVNSSFLGGLVTEKFVGLIYTVGSLVTILGFIFLPFILNKFGNYKTALWLLLFQITATLVLSFSANSFFLIFFFLISFLIIPFLYFSLDIFLEGFSDNGNTGSIRGKYLSLGNMAWVLGPLAASFVLFDNNYQTIYLISFLLLLPVFLILVLGLKKFRDSRYQVTHTVATLNQVWHDRDLRNIFAANFLLQFFYSWMVIYTPIYLHENIGLSWSAIGLIFSVMLLPFVLFEYPLGRLSDSRWGEKELLVAGFIVIAISTGAIFFIASQSVLVWMAILFLTRVGASVIEIMCETYFFKKMNSQNANMISLFRISRPAAYVLGPLCATVLLNLFNLDLVSLFIVLGAIMLLGLRFSLRLTDTN